MRFGTCDGQKEQWTSFGVLAERQQPLILDPSWKHRYAAIHVTDDDARFLKDGTVRWLQNGYRFSSSQNPSFS